MPASLQMSTPPFRISCKHHGKGQHCFATFAPSQQLQYCCCWCCCTAHPPCRHICKPTAPSPRQQTPHTPSYLYHFCWQFVDGHSQHRQCQAGLAPHCIYVTDSIGCCNAPKVSWVVHNGHEEICGHNHGLMIVQLVPAGTRIGTNCQDVVCLMLTIKAADVGGCSGCALQNPHGRKEGAQKVAAGLLFKFCSGQTVLSKDAGFTYTAASSHVLAPTSRLGLMASSFTSFKIYMRQRTGSAEASAARYCY